MATFAADLDKAQLVDLTSDAGDDVVMLDATPSAPKETTKATSKRKSNKDSGQSVPAEACQSFCG